ncbi:DUF3934 family protein [Peribacillus sp. SI8-4]|uniref:DUF3934 family protein n=1 Tax=Peribacillus sp. SI8-4 TaxID=3048009 RepID=UPI00255618ED|nr:DUF3934 family protein [Peribacillus sp. SI8-4]
MSKAKAKSGTGKGTGTGTGKKGWNRWKTSANKKKSAKPYVSKGVKHSNDPAGGKTDK